MCLFPLKQDVQCLLIGGEWAQKSQQIKCIRIQVDCRIHSKVSEPIAARFGRPLIVECLFNHQAQLHQHQSKIKLSHINPFAIVSPKRRDPFLQRQFPVYCQIHLLGGFWGSTHIKFMQRNYFSSTWVNCCFDFICQLPVDCWPDSVSWGSTWSADHTLFSFWGRSKSKSIICFWQIHHILTDNYPRSMADCWDHQSRHQERAGIKGSVDHFTHASQQELQVYCCISLFQNIPSLQQRYCNILCRRSREHEQWKWYWRRWSHHFTEVKLTIVALVGISHINSSRIGRIGLIGHIGCNSFIWPNQPHQLIGLVKSLAYWPHWHHPWLHRCHQPRWPH